MKFEYLSKSRGSFGVLAPPAAAALLAVVLLVSAGSAGAANRTSPTARVAHTLNDTATAELHLLRPEGSELIEAGPVSGALRGSMDAQLRTGAVFTGSFTIHTRNGTISGWGKANPHGSGRYQSFSGNFTVTRGSGRYLHVKGNAGLYGVFDRRTDSVTIQTTGKLTY